ncbi:HIT family protein [Gordonia sp. (in: high G+C Gram-positive bacteria)]|uniref:HIT family protein n=1 Tax=Gordonia sp. (in: high G+C Gram-positive bacteria) TaxID=84139 RepID=UPI00333F5A2B
MADCPFCDYAALAQQSAEKRTTTVVRGRQVTVDPSGVMCFEPINAVTPGHMLFVHVDHIEHSDEHANGYVGLLMSVAHAYAHRVAHAAGFNLIVNAGEAATQTIDHLHVHYVPRRRGDGLTLPWTGQATS